jgi:gas vesicle protein
MPNFKSLLIGFAFGSVVSGISTLLATPKSGQELRKEIKYSKVKAQSAMNQAKHGATTLKSDLVNLTKDSSSLIKEVTSELKEDIQSYQKNIEPNLKSIKDGIKKVENTLAETKKRLS